MADEESLKDALALLARGLQGAMEVAGLESLPRPVFSASTGPAGDPAPSGISSTSATSAPPPGPLPPSSVVKVGPEAVGAAIPLPEPGLAQALAAVVGSDGGNAERLRILQEDIVGACVRCRLHRGRNKLVFGVGNPGAELVFVGEGPGADEDRQGVPFVGRAGQLLTKMIEAMGFARDDVYICNVVKCRPPNNRDPEPEEVEACEPFLKAQLGILKPRIIVALGRYAVQTLLRTHAPISKLRGQWHSYEGIDVMPTYHPSFLLREERDPKKTRKREAWSDLQQVMQAFGKTPPPS